MALSTMQALLLCSYVKKGLDTVRLTDIPVPLPQAAASALAMLCADLAARCSCNRCAGCDVAAPWFH